MLRLLLILAASRAAASSPMLWELPDAEAGKGLSFSVGAGQSVKEFYSDGSDTLIYQRAGDGTLRSLKGLRLGLEAAYTHARGSRLALLLPYLNTEFSPNRPGQLLPYAVDDALAARGDGVGDIKASWAEPWWRRGLASAFSVFSFSAPTGLSAFASQHPLVATGSGEFQASLSLGLEGR